MTRTSVIRTALRKLNIIELWTILAELTYDDSIVEDELLYMIKELREFDELGERIQAMNSGRPVPTIKVDPDWTA